MQPVNLLLLVSAVCATRKSPSVFVSVLVRKLSALYSSRSNPVPQVRNKAHTLPYVLTLLEGLSYPKDRMVLHIRSDLNQVNIEQTKQNNYKTILLNRSKSQQGNTKHPIMLLGNGK